MEDRPYREINEPPKPGLVHAVIGAVLFVLIFFALLAMWALIGYQEAQFNDRAPTLEQAEKAVMSPQKGTEVNERK